MQLLLDTHIWLWSHGDRKKLSRRVTRCLEDSRNELWISPMSVWEILALCQKGRLDLDGGPVAWIANSRQRIAYREAMVTNEVALATEAFALPHRDPIDALLVASANVYGLTLVTADAKLIASKACPVLSNL